jgi:hypothetical protein
MLALTGKPYPLLCGLLMATCVRVEWAGLAGEGGGCAQHAGTLQVVRSVAGAAQGMAMAVGSRAHLEARAIAQRAW